MLNYFRNYSRIYKFKKPKGFRNKYYGTSIFKILNLLGTASQYLVTKRPS
jgi:hypothetical protein